MDATKFHDLAQSAINLLCASAEWNALAHLRAQSLGLQGEKREARIDEHDAMWLKQYIASTANDLFGAEMRAYPVQLSLPDSMNSIPGYFEGLRQKLEDEYDHLHRIANELVVAGFRPIAEKLYCRTDALFCRLIEVRRTVKEGALADWAYHHVSRYQVGYHNVHDDAEKKERDRGYPG